MSFTGTLLVLLRERRERPLSEPSFIVPSVGDNEKHFTDPAVKNNDRRGPEVPPGEEDAE
jgi:hypothetical protein